LAKVENARLSHDVICLSVEL